MREKNLLSTQREVQNSKQKQITPQRKITEK